MQRILLLLLFISVNCHLVFAQNYVPIQSDDERFYSHDGVIWAFQVEASDVIDGDTLLYLSPTIQRIDENCQNPFSPNWIGSPVEVRANGEVLFFNYDSEIIRLETMAETGESWNLFDRAGGISVEATIASIETEEIFGEFDQVKTISMEVFDANGNEIAHPLEDLTIRLSENFGLLTTLNFYNFPDFENNFYAIGLSEFDLVGLNSQGVENLFWLEVFDFEPGDEFHIESTAASFGEVEVDQLVQRILEREDVSGGVIYTVEEILLNYETLDSELQFIGSDIDTVEWEVNSNPQFNTLPHVPIVTELGTAQEAYTYTMKIENDRRVKVNQAGGFSVLAEEDAECWGQLIDGGCLDGQEEEFIEGLGGPYFDCAASQFTSVSRQLVYYNDGGEEFGDPFDLTVLSVNSADDFEFSLYPNPAGSVINLEWNNNVVVESARIIDLEGKTVLKLNQTQKQFDVSALSPGIYLIEMSLGADRIYRKFNKL